MVLHISTEDSNHATITLWKHTRNNGYDQIPISTPNDPRQAYNQLFLSIADHLRRNGWHLVESDKENQCYINSMSHNGGSGCLVYERNVAIS